MYPNVSKFIQMYANVYKYIQMYTNVYKCKQMYTNVTKLTPRVDPSKNFGVKEKGKILGYFSNR